MADTSRPASPPSHGMRPGAVAAGVPAALGRPFAALTGANLAAQSAEQISLAAVPIVAVLVHDAGPAQIGLLNTAQSLPFLLLAIPLGVWADRHSRRRLMLAAEAVRALSLAGLWMAVGSHHGALWLLAGLGFLGAAGTVGFSVAAPALVPRLVPHAALGLANGRLELARSMAFAGGPALAGALVTWAGASWAFAVATALSLVALGLLKQLPEPALAPVRPRHPWVEVKEGARQVWHHPLLKPVLLTAVVWNLAWFVLQAAYVPHAMRTLGLDARGVGLTLAAYGVGMVMGALAATRVMARLPFGVVVCVGPVVSVLAAATLASSIVWPHAALAAWAMFLFGAGPILWTISSVTLRQTVTPHAMLGRVSAIFLAANSGARPLGALLGSAVGALTVSLAGAGTSQAGEVACLLLALVGFTGQAAVILTSPARALTGLPAPVVPDAGR